MAKQFFRVQWVDKSFGAAPGSGGISHASGFLGCDMIQRQIERKKTSIPLRNLRDLLKSHPVFAGMPKLTEHLKTKVLPDLEAANYVVFANNVIYFNPSLR